MRALKRLNAWINDKAIRDIDSRIHVVNITENAPEIELTWGSNPGRHGQRLLGRTRKNLRVSIEFDLRELYNLADRASIVDAVNAWAADGILKVSHRPSQRLRVIRAAPAAFNGARDVTESYTVELEADAYPFWEDELPTRLELSGSTNSGTVIVPGSAQALPEISVTPTSGTLDALSLTINGKTMVFADLGITTGTLVIDHDNGGYLRIHVGNTSKMEKRTAASADDFVIAPGAMAVSYTADTACGVTVSARGRYL